MTRPVRPVRPTRPFVGRARELKIVAASLAGLVAGRGGALLLAGEPGIGKTGLAEQIAVQAAALGVPTVWGRCVEDEGAPALWPWRQILSDCRRRQMAREPGASVPGMAASVLDVAGRGGRGTAAPPSDSSERFRLFESVTETG